MPFRKDTVYILSIDGGGAKGYIPVLFLKRWCLQVGIPENELWKHFDVICGTSIGAIQALAYAAGFGPSEIESLFLVEAKRIFTIRNAAELLLDSNTASQDSNKPTEYQKLLILSQKDQFYRAKDPIESNYGDAKLKSVIRSRFGNMTLNDLKTNTIIPAYKSNAKAYTLFSNAVYPEFVGPNTLISDVAIASSAAPIYLPAYEFGGNIYEDGGLFQNNPAALGETLAKMLKPTARRIVVLSLGCGIGDEGYHDDNDGSIPDPSNTLFAYAKDKMLGLIKTGISGPQESIALNLKLRNLYTLDKLHYYRFQPKYPTDFDTDIDNSTPEYFQSLANITESTYNFEIDDISTFIGHFLA